MSLFDQLGEATIAKIVGGFYERVRQDDLLRPLYPPDDWDGAEEKLRDFLIFRFGGPQRYLEKRGHPRLRRRHLPFAIGIPERDRWLQLMGESLDEAEVPRPAREEIDTLFFQIADFMRNQPE